MAKYDVFVCYRGKSGWSCELGTKIRNNPELKKKYRTFFAPECIEKGVNFKKEIQNVMASVSVVILLIDNTFFTSCLEEDDIVYFEMQEALKKEDILFLPIIVGDASLKEIDLSTLFNETDIERIRHINEVRYYSTYDFKIESDLLPVLDRLYDGGDLIATMSKRSRERYYGGSDVEEKEFLVLQKNMLDDYDRVVYDKIFDTEKSLNVLDIGCNNGNLTHSRFGGRPNINKIVGIDFDSECIKQAKENYPGIIFASIDIEEQDFLQSMKSICLENDIDSFDVINITMVLLHLEHPNRFLGRIKKFLKNDGYLFIRDIDDDFNFAFPDNDGYFKRMMDICKYCDMLGYRNSGKEIYSYLKQNDYRNVCVERMGLNTSSMTYDEKEALFDIYFGYIPTALEKTIQRKGTRRAIHDYEWVLNIMDDANEQFHKGDFLFSLGYIIYTAQK